MNALYYGSWISQEIVRQSVGVAGCKDGGDGKEILHTNIECALNELKFNVDGWAYHTEPRPQAKRYLVWLKEHLAKGEPCIWFIYCKGDGGSKHVHGPHGSEKGYGFYDHIEPVIGIASNHSLAPGAASVSQYFADDVIAHHSDWDQKTYFRTFASIPDGPKMDGNCAHVFPMGGGPNEAHPCIPEQVDYGYALLGRKDPLNVTQGRVHLAVDSWKEPDVVEGYKPDLMTGTVTVAGLEARAQYTLLRFDGYKTVPADSKFKGANYTHAESFAAGADGTWTWTDPAKISSDRSVYYYALKASDV